ncbi:MAG: polysaccharide deacetylase family protein [Alphaproteobacteria bacterium]
MRLHRLAAVLAASLALCAPGPCEAGTSAVVLMYHGFGDGGSSTNTGIAQFEAQLAELRSGGYAVLPLSRVVEAIRDGQPLPDLAVAITINDAPRSAYEVAWPRLRAAGLPFTVFVTTSVVDHRGRAYMSWDQLRELARAGVEIGAQTHDHPHMPAQSADRNRAEMETANQRIAAETGHRPTLFAYPYGEAGTAEIDLVRAAGYGAAFGQHSGPVHPGADLHSLPRFPLGREEGGIDRFRRILRTLPLPVEDVRPANPALTSNPPRVEFTVAEGVEGLERIGCYASHTGRLVVERHGRRVSMRPPRPFPPTRGRINCTVPTDQGRWRWFGMQVYVQERK